MRLTITLVILSVMSLALLTYGLRGIVVKRPVVYPARFRYWFVVLGLTPMIVSLIEMMSDPLDGSFDVLGLLLILMFVGLLIFSWWHLSGYIASGVTYETFQTALHTSLEKLNLPYKESLSRLELTSLNADLQASVQSWAGTAQLKMKERRYKQTLRDIAQKMNEYYRQTPVKANLAPSIITTVIGIMALILIIYITVARMRRGF